MSSLEPEYARRIGEIISVGDLGRLSVLFTSMNRDFLVTVGDYDLTEVGVEIRPGYLFSAMIDVGVLNPKWLHPHDFAAVDQSQPLDSLFFEG